jgi:hypothetical protein
MAIVLRSQIDLRAWAEFVSKGPDEAARFLNEVNIDIRELHEKMDKAYPGVMEPLPAKITGRRVDFSRVDDQEAYDYKTLLQANSPQRFANPAAGGNHRKRFVQGTLGCRSSIPCLVYTHEVPRH